MIEFSALFIVEIENIDEDLKILKIIRNIFNKGTAEGEGSTSPKLHAQLYTLRWVNPFYNFPEITSTMTSLLMSLVMLQRLWHNRWRHLGSSPHFIPTGKVHCPHSTLYEIQTVIIAAFPFKISLKFFLAKLGKYTNIYDGFICGFIFHTARMIAGKVSKLKKNFSIPVFTNVIHSRGKKENLGKCQQLSLLGFFSFFPSFTFIWSYLGRQEACYEEDFNNIRWTVKNFTLI